MNSLVPHLKLRVLCLEHRGTCFGVFPVLEFYLIIERENVFDLKTLGPRIDQTLFGSAEMVLIMTLATNKCPHLLAGCLFVDIVVLKSLRGLESADSLNKSRTGNS